jgi:hypothetical protein
LPSTWRASAFLGFVFISMPRHADSLAHRKPA